MAATWPAGHQTCMFLSIKYRTDVSLCYTCLDQSCQTCSAKASHDVISAKATLHYLKTTNKDVFLWALMQPQQPVTSAFQQFKHELDVFLRGRSTVAQEQVGSASRTHPKIREKNWRWGYEACKKCWLHLCLCLSLFCSCHSFTPAPAVWWIIEECLSSLAPLVNQSSAGCPPHFNKSFRPSGQVHQSRRSQGHAGNSSAIFSHNIQNTIPTSAPTSFHPVLPCFTPSSPLRLLSSLPFLPRRIPVWDDVTLTRPQWTLQHRVTKGMF